MKDVLHQFLQDVAQGVYGESKLNYSRVNAFMNVAQDADLQDLAEYFWEYKSTLTNPDDIDVNDVDELIEEVIKQNK